MTGDIPVEFASLASPLACVTWLRFQLGKRAYVESDVSFIGSHDHRVPSASASGNLPFVEEDSPYRLWSKNGRI